jgi:nucleoside 2-deoxyribosyltransferase
MRFYLGGPINGCTDNEAHGWRERVKVILSGAGHQWVDPMDRDYRGREMEPGIAAAIVENDKADIDTCDILLMNCPKPSVGTSMEVFYGWSIGKRVIAVVPPEGEPSPWLVYHTHTITRESITMMAELLASAYKP